MLNEILSPSPTEQARPELKSYNVTIPMESLAIGVDNIHHDVFLSPKFVQIARDYLFDVIRHSTSNTYLAGLELRASRSPDGTGFRKLLSEVLQSSLTQAKYYKNIEIDLLFRLGLLKFLTFEIGNQFANLILEGKEWIRKRGEHFERSQQAHVIKARVSELQSARRSVIRRVGQQVAQIVIDVEDNVIAKTRRALFGEDFAPYYELCKNRLIFLDGGKDDFFFLEHYILLGNYARDPDRFEAMDELFQEFLREAGVTFSHDPAHTEAIQAHTGLLEAVQAIQSEIANIEEQRENIRKRLERNDGFFSKFLNSDDPADLKASLNDLEARLKHQECKLEELGPQIDSARQKLDFFVKDHAGRLGEYLNEPENAKRLFDASSAGEEQAPVRARLLSQLLDRLELQEVLYHILASYEIQPIASDYCPPVHLQQLRKALVSKEELKQVEQVIKHVPAKKLSLKAVEELSRKIRRYSREEKLAFVLRFASDFLRLRRDLHEPVRKLLDRYAAKKVFIEGDPIILAIFETESTVAYARSVAKACILSRQILAVCNSYNERPSDSNLPSLELGLGVAFQGSAPTYWTDGDSRIMISKALNLSDRLSGCAKLAKRMLVGQKSHFSVFQFLNTMEGASAEELDEFLVRYNHNGIELNEEGSQKLSEEISLETIETKLDMPWGKEDVTLCYGEVPLGESVELRVLRKA